MRSEILYSTHTSLIFHSALLIYAWCSGKQDGSNIAPIIMTTVSHSVTVINVIRMRALSTYWAEGGVLTAPM